MKKPTFKLSQIVDGDSSPPTGIMKTEQKRSSRSKDEAFFSEVTLQRKNTSALE